MAHERYTSEEAAYRRGYSHGFETGLTTATENKEKIRDEIARWRNDEENMKGAPGTRFSNTHM